MDTANRIIAHPDWYDTKVDFYGTEMYARNIYQMGSDLKYTAEAVISEQGMIMKIKDVIEILKEEGTWVRWNRCTRDRVLFGDDDQEVKKIGVCWVATNKVIEQALEKLSLIHI